MNFPYVFIKVSVAVKVFSTSRADVGAYLQAENDLMNASSSFLLYTEYDHEISLTGS